MPVDTQQIVDQAATVSELLAQHPAVDAYRKAQKAVADDPDASRTLGEFDRLLESLEKQQMQGLPVTDAQRTQLESLQSRIVSNIKVKALNTAHVEFMDLLRRANQALLSKVGDAAAPAHARGAGARGM
jgi:cell fate (sporulation/competence/biofilm development) regulator YlbF (YheA/YmcA/DUF963 family)